MIDSVLSMTHDMEWLEDTTAHCSESDHRSGGSRFNEYNTGDALGQT